MTTTRVCDLKAGDAVDCEFGVVERSRPKAKNGQPYAQLEVRDASGTINAKKFDISDRDWEAIAGVACVRVRGQVQAYNGKLGIVADSICPGADPDRVEGFIPEYPGDRRALWKAFGGLARSVREPFLSELLRRVFSLPGVVAGFRQATAAQKMHHVGVGGLLAHTVEVANLCMAVCEKAPGLQRDLLLTGALLHDIGKIDEMDSTRADFDATLEGGLVGHVVMGAALVQGVIAGIPEFPPTLRAAVLHLILTHQGTREWGAPVLPAIPEALVLHLCDNVSAKMDEFAKARSEAASGELFAYSRAVGTRVFLGEIEVSSADAGEAPQWSLADDDETGRPVLRIVTGGLEPGEALPEMAVLPILGSIAAGSPIDAQEHVDGYRAVEVEARADAGDFLLRVSGDSMRDAHILDRDLVRVRPLTGDPRDGDIVAALLNGEVTVKRYQTAGSGFVLHPENPDFHDIEVGTGDSVLIQGRVVGLIREQVQ